MNGIIPIAKPIVGKQEEEAVLDVLRSGHLAQGKKVVEFERRFAEFCGCRFAVAVSSGTAALHCALYASGVMAGDEVITVPFTFGATANAILMSGARPVFVDIDENDYNMDPDCAERAITSRTKAILAVDLFGHPYAADRLRRIASKHGLVLIEDAAQAVGATFRERKAGSLGDIGTFSFYATKNLMTGEGGMITTDNEEFARRAQRFRHHGQHPEKHYEYFDLGYNYRMMDLQAAIGLCQMNQIDGFNERRKRNAAALSEGLKGIRGLILPSIGEGIDHVFHQYTVRVSDDFPISRDELREVLASKGVGSAVFYPKPLHLHSHFRKYGFQEGEFPIAESCARQVLSLPVHPSVTSEDISLIIKAIREVADGTA